MVEGQSHVLHTAKKPEHEIPSPVEVPDYAHLLPEPIRKFTRTIQDAKHLSFIQGAGHGGSHPHLVNEFLSALVADRDPWAQRRAVGQLDVRRHLRARIGHARRAGGPPAGVYAGCSGARHALSGGGAP